MGLVLLTCASPLVRSYDLAMLDLDGVVYIGSAAVPGAADHIAAAREEGMRVAFITNNASRTPVAVAEHLTALGVSARSEDVVTSAQAAARLVLDRWGAGARVVCLGGTGLHDALEQAGLVPVGVEEDAVAVASGYGPDLRWSEIMRAAVRIRDGLAWVASNTDHTIPTPFGVAPGHGVLVDTLRRFTGVEPSVAGKPARPLLDETVRRVGGERPLMVGDRLDTDIEGARRAGLDSLLVLTGVTGLPELVAAPPPLRPTYVAPDLGGLAAPHAAPVCADDASWRLGAWRGTVEAGALRIEAAADAPAGDGDHVGDWWRVAAAVAWEHLDTHGTAVDVTGLHVPGPPGPAR